MSRGTRAARARTLDGNRVPVVFRGEALRHFFKQRPRCSEAAQLLFTVGDIEDRAYRGIQAVALAELGTGRHVILPLRGAAAFLKERLGGRWITTLLSLKRRAREQRCYQAEPAENDYRVACSSEPGPHFQQS